MMVGFLLMYLNDLAIVLASLERASSSSDFNLAISASLCLKLQFQSSFVSLLTLRGQMKVTPSQSQFNNVIDITLNKLQHFSSGQTYTFPNLDWQPCC